MLAQQGKNTGPLAEVLMLRNARCDTLFERFPLAHLPTPVHSLKHLSKHLGGPQIWIKRDDCTGLAGGGNKTRKLEYLVADALCQNADTLVTIGGIQSNHTRQTAAAAAVAGLDCILLHARWVEWDTPHYDKVGNFLFGQVLGAEVRIIDLSAEKGLLASEHLLRDVGESLRSEGKTPYLIPSGASDHRLGGLGYLDCAAELVEQQKLLDVQFDHLIHATSSGSTQAGLVVGFQALDWPTNVIGVDVNSDADWMRRTVAKIANQTAGLVGLECGDSLTHVNVEANYAGPAYGVPDEGTREAIQLVGSLEGILLDPVYEGKSMAALIGMVREGSFSANEQVLFHYLGGSAALHAYSDLFSGSS